MHFNRKIVFLKYNIFDYLFMLKHQNTQQHNSLWMQDTSNMHIYIWDINGLVKIMNFSSQIVLHALHLSLNPVRSSMLMFESFTTRRKDSQLSACRGRLKFLRTARFLFLVYQNCCVVTSLKYKH